MSRDDGSIVRGGTAWLVADSQAGDYLCYWYAGTGDGRLVEQARAGSAERAVAWGRFRTSKVRIRDSDGHTAWAGAGPTPGAFGYTWAGDGGQPPC